MTLEELRAKVKRLFPGFKSHGILRFSSLLGVGKPSSQPRIWREASKPKKKKKKSLTRSLDLDVEVPAEMVESGDEVLVLGYLKGSVLPSAFTFQEKFLSGGGKEVRPSTLQSATSKSNQYSGDPLTRQWRFGPARVWYDAIGVPEDGQTLDYGFQLKVK